MVGFSYKNLLLQIIHGSVVILTIIFLGVFNIDIDHCFNLYGATACVMLFLFLAFFIGVGIDFVADILESVIIRFVIYPPAYFLLTRNMWFWIALAHRETILKDLCKIAAKYKSEKGDKETMEQNYKRYKDEFDKKRPDKKLINYILQVAKNKAFRECKDYQKEQIESFFILYIFSRNMSLSLLISAILFLSHSNICLAIVLFSFVLLTSISSYRYYLYYARILLGTTIQEEKKESVKVQLRHNRHTLKGKRVKFRKVRKD